jgi:RNA polymerase sigma-70 factor (ECF subfamily)
MLHTDGLAAPFEDHRAHLRAVAYRMLGSLAEADDAVQEAWLRVSRAGTSGVDNLGGWLTTIVARVCLDQLRARAARREEPLGASGPEPRAKPGVGIDPEYEAQLADSVGLALLVVLDTLAPAERLALVLHDMFAVPFDDIASILGRSPAAARQLASRARRRVRGTATVPDADLVRQRQVIHAFLAASRGGDFEALVAMLDPDAVLRADSTAFLPGGSRELRGAPAVAGQALKGGARAARPALVNGVAGVIVAPRGRLLLVLAVTIRDDRIVEIGLVADPDRLRRLDLGVLEGGDR